MNANSILDSEILENLKDKRKAQPESICIDYNVQSFIIIVLQCIWSPFVDLLLSLIFVKSYMRKATIEIRISSYLT